MWLRRYSVIVLGQPLKRNNTWEKPLKNFLSNTKTSKQQFYGSNCSVGKIFVLVLIYTLNGLPSLSYKLGIRGLSQR